MFLIKLLVAVVVIFTKNEARRVQASVFVLQPVSSDTNAENLSATYEPHVCLAKEAFLQLLSNSVGFPEAWELPVCVKVNPAKGTNLPIMRFSYLNCNVRIGRETIY